MPDYSFERAHVALVNALNAHIQPTFPDVAGYDTSGDNVIVNFPYELTTEQQATLAALVASYTDPPYWLDLQRTETIAMRSPATSSLTPVFMQAFIVAVPDNLGFMGECSQSMKTVVRYAPVNLAHFVDWDSNVSPVQFTLDIQDYTHDDAITTITDDISNMLTGWQELAQAGSNTAPAIFKTIQLYGLNPTTDSIWNVFGSISNSNVSAGINGMQKLYYSVTRP